MREERYTRVVRYNGTKPCGDLERLTFADLRPQHPTSPRQRGGR